MTDTYCFADRTIRVTSLHERVHRYCEAYRTDGAPDFCVTTDQADIEYERKKSAEEDARMGVPTRVYSDGYLEELAVYRKIAERMPEYDTFLFHGSIIAVDGSAYAFTAKSGTGKSTHARLWRELLGDRAVMVNDDKPLIRLTADGPVAYGTPYNGKHGLGERIAVPLVAVCLLERAAENHIERIAKSDAYFALLQQTYRPMDVSAAVKTLTLLERMADAVRLYRLGCNMDPSAAVVAFESMRRAD